MIVSNFPTGDTRDNTYGICATDPGTVAKVVSLSGFKLEDGATITVKFNNANSAANPTMNVNGTGAYPIQMYGTTAFEAYMWQAGEVVELVFDGTNWMLVDGAMAATIHLWYDKAI